jgi:hypothetical protein
MFVPVQTISPPDASTIYLQIVDHDIKHHTQVVVTGQISCGLLFGLKSPPFGRQKSGSRVSPNQGRHSRHGPHTILCHGGQDLRDTFKFYNKIGLDRDQFFELSLSLICVYCQSKKWLVKWGAKTQVIYYKSRKRELKAKLMNESVRWETKSNFFLLARVEETNRVPPENV